MNDISFLNVESYLYLFQDRNNDFNGIGWVEPIFISMTRAYQTSQQLVLYVDNDYFRKMLLDKYKQFKTYSPVERINDRLDVEKVANHIASIILQNYKKVYLKMILKT